METLGFLVRIWLWISVPMAVVILLVASYFNYWHNTRPKGGLKLAIEGWGADMGTGGSEPFIRKEDIVGEGAAVIGEEEEESTPRGPIREEGVPEGPGMGEKDREDEELGATGKETIYRGILWMKEKYEQYREQADRKFEQLREELGRSDHRYQEVLAMMEQNKNRALDLVDAGSGEDVSPQVTVTQVSMSQEEELAAKQAIIEKLEAQLRSERVKVEELVSILQSNMQMLRKVVPDLGK